MGKKQPHPAVSSPHTVRGSFNMVTDRLTQGQTVPGEWSLNPEIFLQITQR